MTLMKRLSVFAAKTETVIGTPETLTAAEGVYNAYEPMIQAEIEMQEREGQGSFDYLPAVGGPRMGAATFRTDVEYDGVSIPDWAAVLLPACGWVDTAGTFSPLSEGLKAGGATKSLTIGCYTDGRFKVISGAQGNFNFVFEAGKVAQIEWDFMGIMQDVTDAPLISPVYPVTPPARFADSPTTLGGYNLCLANLSINSGNEIAMRECQDTAQGYESALIRDRYPTINCDPEAQLVATWDDYGNWFSNAENAFTTQLKTADTSTIDITAPKAQIFGIEEGDRDRLVIDTLDLRCNKNGATIDQSLQIVFTPTV